MGQSDTEPTPRTVGRFRITGTLGEGGMGIVYAAHDDQLDRPVAIKMLRAHDSDEQSRERLRREARAAASVSHPNICQLYEIGEEGGELFLAMEYLEGEPLAERVERGALPLSEALQIAFSMLAALGVIHRRGLVHRDLKPTNVFLTPAGVKLLDFGVVRTVADDTADTQVELTHPGAIVGTPRWSSPEQLTAAPVDRRSDIFAVGQVLYYMLAGKPMFEGQNVLQVFHAVVYDPPPVLGGSPEVGAVDGVIHRAVAKRPEDRYQTAEEMTADLRAATVFASTREPVRAVPMTRFIALPLKILRPDADTDFLAFSLPDEVTNSLSGLQSLVVRSTATASKLVESTPDLEELGRKADVDVILAGTLLRSGDEVRVSTQLVEARGGEVLWSQTSQIGLRDAFQLQDDLARRIVESLSVPLSTRDRKALDRGAPATPEAYELYLRGNQLGTQATDWTNARDAYLACLEHDPLYAPAWARLGRTYRVLGLYGGPGSDESYARAQQAFRRALELDPDLAIAHNLSTNLDVEVGDAQAAMLRLLRLITHRSADPELYAGLVQACRYCDLLEASVAAFERARHLDPGIQTSAAHTYLALADYQRADEVCVDNPPFVRAWALALMGREAEAADVLKPFETASLPHAISRYIAATQAVLRGQTDEARRLNWEIARSSKLRDPCAIFYLGHNLAAVGDVDHALTTLRRAVDGGFGCFTLLARDPWLDSLRGHPEFEELVQVAQTRRAEAQSAFVEAGGDRLLLH